MVHEDIDVSAHLLRDGLGQRGTRDRRESPQLEGLLLASQALVDRRASLLAASWEEVTREGAVHGIRELRVEVTQKRAQPTAPKGGMTPSTTERSAQPRCRR